MKKSRIIISLIIAFSVFILLLIEGLSLSFNNGKDADETIDMLLNQIETVIDKNEENINTLTKTLKDEYIIRCRAVAYTISHNNVEPNQNELKKIAKLTLVDEIHLFDKSGKLYLGTNPEYYGMDILSYDDSEQIAYFKPMISDTSLEMVQDVMENTAVESKQMMYAMVWADTKEYMVQIGISPKRLLHEMNTSTIDNMIKSMPMIEGINIYVSDKDGNILGTTNSLANNMNIIDVCKDKSDSHWNRYHDEEIFDDNVRCIFKTFDNYDVGITYSYKNIQEGLLQILLITAGYLILAGGIIYTVLHILQKNIKRHNDEIKESKDALNKQYEIMRSLSEIYHSMHLIDLDNDSLVTYRTTPEIQCFVDEKTNNIVKMQNIMTARCDEKFKEMVIDFTNLATIKERLNGKKSISIEFLNLEGKWLQASFIQIEQDELNNPKVIFFTTRNIDEEKKRELELIKKSTTDELTGLYNRRRYEEDLLEYTIAMPKSLVIISMDVNGLKKVNDTLGHVAGDELIKGAALCMKHSFGMYGGLYRIGGDEFQALLIIDSNTLIDQINDFNNNLKSYNGNYVSEISVSLGCVECDNSDESLKTLEKIADEKMYENKREYYKEMNIERR